MMRFVTAVGEIVRGRRGGRSLHLRFSEARHVLGMLYAGADLGRAAYISGTLSCGPSP